MHAIPAASRKRPYPAASALSRSCSEAVASFAAANCELFVPAATARPARTVNGSATRNRTSACRRFMSGPHRCRVRADEHGVRYGDDLVDRQVGDGGVLADRLGARRLVDANGSHGAPAL